MFLIYKLFFHFVVSLTHYIKFQCNVSVFCCSFFVLCDGTRMLWLMSLISGHSIIFYEGFVFVFALAWCGIIFFFFFLKYVASINKCVQDCIYICDAYLRTRRGGIWLCSVSFFIMGLIYFQYFFNRNLFLF